MKLKPFGLSCAMLCLVVACKKTTKILDATPAKNGALITHTIGNKPNVLFIIADDLRYWSVNRLYEQAGLEPADPTYGNRGGGNNMVPKTDNIDSLIDGGNAVTFTNAYSTGVECCPSRTSFLFGKYPHQSGIYRNGNHWGDGTGVTQSKALTMQFVNDPDYKVFGAGKIFHISSPNSGALAQWKYFNPAGATSYNNFIESDFYMNGNNSGYSNGTPNSPAPGYTYQIFNYNANRSDFSLDTSNNVTDDAKSVTFCINKMQDLFDNNQGKPDNQKKPFFVACGIRRPHNPLIVPQVTYNAQGAAVTPKILPDDISALPAMAQELITTNPAQSPKQLIANNLQQWQEYVKSYNGAVTYMDRQVGRLLDFINNKPALKANTIIIFISDHGVHLGEKNHIHKTTLYEETARVPMVWRVPGQGTGNPKYCSVPVDLMSIYPTLMDYCGMSVPAGVNGRDIRNLITNPGTAPDPSLSGIDVALTVMNDSSASLRNINYRFTQYHGGGASHSDASKEEIYNHTAVDPLYSFDPWEARDLRSLNPAFLAGMRNRFNARIQSWESMKGPVKDDE